MFHVSAFLRVSFGGTENQQLLLLRPLQNFQSRLRDSVGATRPEQSLCSSEACGGGSATSTLHAD